MRTNKSSILTVFIPSILTIIALASQARAVVDTLAIRRLICACNVAAQNGDLRQWIDSANAAVHEAEKLNSQQTGIAKEAHICLGTAYLQCRNFHFAAREFEKVRADVSITGRDDFSRVSAGYARCLIALGKFQLARSLLDQLLATYDRRVQSTQDSLVVVDALIALARWYSMYDKPDSAHIVLTRALATASNEPIDTLTLSSVLEELAYNRVERSDFTGADSAATEAGQMISARYGSTHPLNAPLLRLLGAVRRSQRKLVESREALESAVRLTDSMSEAFSAFRAEIPSDLAYLYWTIGDYAKADSTAKLGAELARSIYGADNPILNNYSNVKGVTAWALGDLSSAQKWFEEGIRVCKASGLTGGSDYAHTVNNLAIIHRRLGHLESAEKLFEESLSLRQRLYGPDHPDVARAIENLANLYIHTGKVDQVEPLMLRAIHIWEKTFGADDWEVAPAAYNLGIAYFSQGKYEKARRSLQRAMKIWSTVAGKNHPFIGKALSALARTFVCLHRPDSAETYYTRLLDLRQDFAKYAFSFSSDANKLRVLAEHPVIDHSLIQAAVSSGDRRLVRLATNMVLRGKAIALDAMRADRSAGWCDADDTLTMAVASYRSVCDSLSMMALALTNSKQASASLARLVESQNSLEALISRRCGKFRRDLQWRSVTAAAVTSALPDSTVLWEFIKYDGYDFDGHGTDKVRQRTPKYAAFLLRRNSEPLLVPLDDGNKIDSLVNKVHLHMAASTGLVFTPMAREVERHWMELGRQLAKSIVDPVLRQTPPGYSVIVSTDGMLSLVPFEALPVCDSTYLVESTVISYLVAGRDLLSVDVEPSGSNSACIWADPAITGSLALEKEVNSDRTSDSASRSSGPCPGGQWQALPQARLEAKTIAELLKDKAGFSVSMFTGEKATERALKQMPQSPRFLHLATHGYYCTKPDSNSVKFDNPLLRSGLILAAPTGEDAKDQDHEDGMLTALEVSALDLSGTDLVCLSACESGRGDVVDAEGVIGLRRAFQLAGCRSLLMSLWSLDDKTAREIVTGFYSNWLDGQSGAKALHTEELRLLAQARRLRQCGHPRFWSGFIFEGVLAR